MTASSHEKISLAEKRLDFLLPQLALWRFINILSPPPEPAGFRFVCRTIIFFLASYII